MARGFALFNPEARPATATGAQARGALAIGRLTMREDLSKSRVRH